MTWAVWRAALMRRDVILTGYISGIPLASEHRVRFGFVVDSARLGQKEVLDPPRLVRLNW